MHPFINSYQGEDFNPLCLSPSDSPNGEFVPINVLCSEYQVWSVCHQRTIVLPTFLWVQQFAVSTVSLLFCIHNFLLKQ